MQWIVARGLGALPPPSEDETWISWNLQHPAGAGTRIICREGSEPLCIVGRGEPQRLPAIAFGADAALCQLGDGVELVFRTAPWWSFVPLSSPPIREDRVVIDLPFQGWRENCWYDGCLLISYGSKAIGAVGAGSAGSLRWDGHELPQPGAPAMEEVMESLERERGICLKQSLSLALRLRAQLLSEQAYDVTIKNWDIATAALLIILRSAYPHTYLRCLDPPPSPHWKRLLENLDYALHGPHEGIVLDLRGLWPAEDADHWLVFLKALQRNVPVLPVTLLRSFESRGDLDPD